MVIQDCRHMHNIFHVKALKTQLLKSLIIPAAKQEDTDYWQIQMNAAISLKEPYFIFQLTETDVYFGILKNRCGIEFLNDVSKNQEKSFHACGFYSVFSTSTGIKINCRYLGETAGHAISRFIFRPNQSNCKFRIKGQYKFLHIVFPEDFADKIINLLFRHNETVEYIAGRYVIKKTAAKMKLPATVELFYNPFFFPCSTEDILANYLSGYHTTIINRYFKYSVFGAHYLKPLTMLALGDFSGYVLKNIKDMHTQITFDNTVTNDKWLTYFLFTLRTHLISLLKEVDGIPAHAKAFFRFRNECVNSYYALKFKSTLPYLFKLLKENQFILKLAAVVSRRDLACIYKAFPEYFNYLFKGMINYRTIDSPLMFTQRQKQLSLLNFFHKSVSLLEQLEPDKPLQKIMDECVKKELLAYRLFYTAGWEDIASVCTQNKAFYDFFNNHLVPDFERDFLRYLTGLHYYKSKARQTYALIMKKLTLIINRLLLLGEISTA
jgi:hypothetical protein